MIHFGLDFGSDTANPSRDVSEGFGLVPKIFKMTNAGRTGRGWSPLPDSPWIKMTGAPFGETAESGTLQIILVKFFVLMFMVITVSSYRC